MNKEDLLFDWSETDGQKRRKTLAAILLGMGLLALWGIISVNVPMREAETKRGAAAILLKERSPGTLLRLRAAEEGPFPGRSKGLDDSFSERSLAISKVGRWTDYLPELTEIPEVNLLYGVDVEADLQAPAFAYPIRLQKEQLDTEDSRDISMPLAETQLSKLRLRAFSSESEAWLPTEVDQLQLPAKVNVSEWRYLASLDETGKVIELVRLDNGAELGASEFEEWLQRQRFQKRGEADDQERWLGIGVQIIR